MLHWGVSEELVLKDHQKWNVGLVVEREAAPAAFELWYENATPKGKKYYRENTPAATKNHYGIVLYVDVGVDEMRGVGEFVVS